LGCRVVGGAEGDVVVLEGGGVAVDDADQGGAAVVEGGVFVAGVPFAPEAEAAEGRRG
jgi:hypothetical protein